MSKHAIQLPNGQKVNWVTTLILAGLHIGAIAAFFFFSWKSFFVALALHWVAVGWGISLGSVARSRIRSGSISAASNVSPGLSAADKKKILEDNAYRAYPRLKDTIAKQANAAH